LEAALACLPALPLVAAPVITYASAIALDELAITAAAGAHSPSHLCRIFDRVLEYSKSSKFEVELARNHAGRKPNGLERRHYLSSHP
jgi:hypothetical protein